MKIIPNYQLAVFSEEEYPEKMEIASQQLAQARQEGTFAGFDGETLYYEYFLAEQSRGAVVIVHGLSEFTQKYHEFAWYLLNQGYDVFLYDQRSHGRSCRLTPRNDMIHVDAFTDYHKDLHCFVQEVVSKATTAPLYLYAHSMGGAVAIQYLAQHPQIFHKAVLSAPMIEPLTGSVSPMFARLMLGGYLIFGNKKDKFWRSKEFDPDYPFERTQDQSRARFQRNMKIRLAEECYCTTPQSVRWVQQSVSLRSRLTSKKCLKKIQEPVLMICAQHDRVVSEKAQEIFAERCPACQRVVLSDSTHAMLCGTQGVISAHVQQVLNHFG